MEGGAMMMDSTSALDPRVPSDCTMASLRRKAWAQSRDSTWLDQDVDHSPHQGSQQDQDTQTAPEEPGPYKITSWLSECRTPLGASLDDQTSSPGKGTLRTGCSFEDDLSLGAEANHLQSETRKADPGFGSHVAHRRTQYKDSRQHMNSTGSGKSSTVSSVSELLDLYEEDPEEILLNLGFGQEDPNLASKIPSRFFNSSSSARGIDIKVYLGAQMQRMELENPNYALTSRFRQIEVLTSVANEFFQLYSQVSGQPVQRITSRDQGGEDAGGEEQAPPLKRSSSALNAAKLLKRTITKHNLLGGASESPRKSSVQQPVQAETQQDACISTPDHQVETQKNARKRDSCSLATVAEETVADGETDKSATPQSNGAPQSQSADLQPGDHAQGEAALSPASQKAPPTLPPPKLCLLRAENTDSFDMEEVQSNEGDVIPSRPITEGGLWRTTSQQSDSSGFAEEPPTDTSNFLQVQESSDSCDSETTVTSHSSQEVATPLAIDQPAFAMLVGSEEEADEGRCGSTGQEGRGLTSEAVPYYSVHQLPPRVPVDSEQNQVQDESADPGSAESVLSPVPSELLDQSAPKPKPEPEHDHGLMIEGADPNEPPGGSGDPPGDTHGPGLPDPSSLVLSSVTRDTDGPGLPDPSSLVLSSVTRDTDGPGLPDPSSLVLKALSRAKQQKQQPSESGPVKPVKARGTLSLQRSSSLPTSLLAPSSVVSSVRIQFGQGQTSCTPPRFSYKYAQDNGDQEEITQGHDNHLSTLIINPASSTSTNDQLQRFPTEAPSPPKSLPPYLLQSPCPGQSPGLSSEWTHGRSTPSWSTQSAPDVPAHFHQNTAAFQTQHGWKTGPVFPHGGPAQSLNPSPNPTSSLNPLFYPNPSFNQQFYHQPSYLHPGFEFVHPTSFLNPSPSPSCGLNHYLDPNPNPLNLHSSLPNIFDLHNPSQTHHSCLTSLYAPPGHLDPRHRSLSNLQQPQLPSGCQHLGLGAVYPGAVYPGTQHPLPGTAGMHQHYYHSPHYAPPNLGYHGCGLPPHHSLSYPRLSPELCSPTPGSSPGSSTTELQLRRVLHDIRGTVLGLNQNRPDTLTGFNDQGAALPRPQSLVELQQKRRSLSLFRSQMMNLELSIIQQQALVYKHLSPADRLEAEQLQSLRSEVREELQELEQQLDDRLMELAHTGVPRDGSVDILSPSSALRAMEPVSHLLQEQLLLQAELSSTDHAPSPGVSALSSGKGGDGETKRGVYRASINITPAPPTRTNAVTKDDQGGAIGGAVGGVTDNLQDLIREIRESLTFDLRQQIYKDIMAAASSQR